MPLGDDAALWDYLASLDQASRLSLLAHCLSFGINALHEKVNPYGAGISASGLTKRMTQSDLVAQAVDLDMAAAGWKPTADTFPGRVTKARIVQAVAEAKGERTAESIAHLKKSDMAARAAVLLEGSGWLPEPLRTPGRAITTPTEHEVESPTDEAMADAIGEAQPAADDGARSVANEAPIDDNAEAEGDIPFAVAAE